MAKIIRYYICPTNEVSSVLKNGLASCDYTLFRDLVIDNPYELYYNKSKKPVTVRDLVAYKNEFLTKYAIFKVNVEGLKLQHPKNESRYLRSYLYISDEYIDPTRLTYLGNMENQLSLYRGEHLPLLWFTTGQLKKSDFLSK